jgi:hypothetical protein
MQTKAEITAGIETRVQEVKDWFGACGGTPFTTGPEGRWTAGQHLDHLIRSTKPLNLALQLPRLVLRIKFGTAKAPGQSFEDLTTRYEATLAAGGKAPGRFVPPEVRAEDRETLIDEFTCEGQRLVAIAGRWNEADLDKYLLPHPLLGNLTVREMLFFTYHHMGHHLETLERDY